MTHHWIGVASADYIARGVAGSFAQLGHGQRAPLARLAKGDRLVYYAPRERIKEGAALRAFVALGVVADEAPGQPDTDTHGPAHPWRLRVDFDRRTKPAPIHLLLPCLHLTCERVAHWGILFRRSLIAIDAHDFALIEAAMHAA